VKLDGSSNIGGWPTPVDATIPTNRNGTTGPGETTGLTAAGTMSTTVVAASHAAGGAKSLQMLSSSMEVAQGFGIVHGPHIISDTAVAIEAGQSVSFDWKAQGGEDWFDVYAYLLNVDDGSTVKLLDATGQSTNWATVTKTVPTAGNYKFVFVSGTYDYSGLRALGARLFVDNIVAPPMANATLNTTSITSVAGATQAMNQLERDMGQVLSARASLGASLNRLTHAADDLAVYSSNLAGSRSRLLDADYAQATAEWARLSAINSAGELALKQARANQQASVGMIQSNGSLFRS
jgi:flagellin-like hook-associated protein FlgL